MEELKIKKAIHNKKYSNTINGRERIRNAMLKYCKKNADNYHNAYVENKEKLERLNEINEVQSMKLKAELDKIDDVRLEEYYKIVMKILEEKGIII